MEITAEQKNELNQFLSLYGFNTISGNELTTEIVNQYNNFGHTPLYIAAHNNETEIAELLVGNGADVNQADNYGDTPLYIAARNNQTEIAELLVGNGADVNQADNIGETPLWVAARNNNTEIAELLVGNGADVNQANNFGETPLLIAARNNQTEIAELLVGNGADVNQADNYGETPLYIAAHNNHTEIAELLVGNGADVNQANNIGDTPLLIAAHYNHTETLRLLVFATRLSGATIPPIVEQNFNTDPIIAKILACEENIFANLRDKLNSIAEDMQNDSWKKEIYRITLDFLYKNLQTADNLAGFLEEVTKSTTKEELNRLNKNDLKGLLTLLWLPERQNSQSEDPPLPPESSQQNKPKPPPLPQEISRQIAKFAGAFSEKKQKELLADHLKGINKLISRLNTLNDDNLPQGIKKEYEEYIYSYEQNNEAVTMEARLEELTVAQLNELIRQTNTIEQRQRLNVITSRLNALHENYSTLPQNVERTDDGEYTYSVDPENGGAAMVERRLNDLNLDQLRELTNFLEQSEREVAAETSQNQSHVGRLAAQRNRDQQRGGGCCNIS